MVGIVRGGQLEIFLRQVEIHGGMGQCTANNKQSLCASTSEERPQKSKPPPEPGLSKVEEVMTVSHLMEWKLYIAIAGGGKYLAWRNKDKIGNLGASQFVRKQQRESKWRRHQIVQYWRSSSS